MAIFFTNDIITEKNLITAQTAQPASPNQGGVAGAQLPQNVLELMKLFLAMNVKQQEIDAVSLIQQQDLARDLVRRQLSIAFPNIINVLNSDVLISFITAAIYQWANALPKTPQNPESVL